ncbi:5-oxoproline transporter, DUF969 family subunit [Aeromonas sp. 164P]
MEWIKLSGILIILLGFYFRLDTLAVVLVAAVTTALVSGLSFTECLSLLGEAFYLQPHGDAVSADPADDRHL